MVNGEQIPRSEYLAHNGTQIFYEVEGTGADTIVLLHGGGPGASSRSNFEQNLPGLGAQYQLVLVDLPGYGRSGPATQASRESAFAYYAAAVAAVLDHLGLSRTHFVGNSLGGGVAFRFALAFPERTGRLVLLGPAGVGYPIFSPTGRIHSSLGDVSANLLRHPGQDTMRAFLEEMVYDRTRITEELVAERLAAFLSMGARDDPASPIFDMWLGANDGVVKFNPADFESWRSCAQVATPTLLVWGRDDHFNPVDCALYPLRYMPDAQLHVFGRCGHWAQVEHRSDFDAVILDFLADDAGGPTATVNAAAGATGGLA
jgi:4,5:9,10-diseco-3-hydroxy-5,9,17-trioxoandrosta-1(10),2-diene-4-oate hydrolase